ncbi:MAG: 5'-deoxynucleotidase [Clostridia bacterium]
MGEHFFAYMARMKYIQRWGLMRNTHQEDIAEHSLQVAMLAHALAVIKNKFYNGNLQVERVLILALYHEASEVITGDLPTPIKYFNPEIKQAYKRIEQVASEKLLELLPEELKPDYTSFLIPIQADQEAYRIVKLADKLAAYLKCLEERRAGNHEFEMAEHTLWEALQAEEAAELKYFLAHFIESFSLTIDELN